MLIYFCVAFSVISSLLKRYLTLMVIREAENQGMYVHCYRYLGENSIFIKTYYTYVIMIHNILSQSYNIDLKKQICFKDVR